MAGTSETKARLYRLVSRLMAEDNSGKAATMAQEVGALAALMASEEGPSEKLDRASTELAGGYKNLPLPVNGFSDADLEEFNLLLPWAAMSADGNGRVLGRPFSDKKRSVVERLNDRRHNMLNDLFPLKGKHVFEVGCFEGLHTLSLIMHGARVTGCDVRIEHLLKTLARVWAYNQKCDVIQWDLEKDVNPWVPAGWDVLHHVGVLYHLSNPVEHLNEVLPRTKGAVLLDTHVARDADEATKRYKVDGEVFLYRHFNEDPDVPFAGVMDHAKWLLTEDLVKIFRNHGFNNVQMLEDRDERNGRRVCIAALKK